VSDVDRIAEPWEQGTPRGAGEERPTPLVSYLDNGLAGEDADRSDQFGSIQTVLAQKRPRSVHEATG
jgi:hypothetical protein